MSSISELLLKYKTDKNYGTIEPKYGHCYGESYDKLFSKYKYQNVTLLEIGVQKGGSLLAWKEYFKNSKIYGIDIVDVVLDEYRKDDINYIISDIKNQNVKKKLENINFDIIIDDGSHLLPDVIYVVNNYLENLNTGGILVIEDCQQPEYWVREISNIIPNNFLLKTIDLRNKNGHYDDYLITIEKT